MNDQEAKYIWRALNAALKAGLRVSVNDGEEWVLKGCTDMKIILAALGSTDMDALRFRHADGGFQGDMTLIYGNSPEEVIADYSDNVLMDSLYKVAQQENA